MMEPNITLVCSRLMIKLVYRTTIFLALAQLKSLEYRLGINKILKKQYSTITRGDLSKSYIVQVEKSNCFKTVQPPYWYLPHHPVFHPHKPAKVRQFLNGAPNFHGRALNIALLTGHDLLQNLIHVLLRFRKHPYQVSAEIKGMFLK